MMRKAHVSYAIVSWWGPGTYEDRVLDKLMNISISSLSPHPMIKWCILYELEGYGDPDPEKILFDLRYIINHYGNRPNYLRINSKPVVFVYADLDDGVEYAEKWSRIRSVLGGSMFIVLKVSPSYKNYTSLSDSWYQYAPSKRYELQPPFSGYVSPGFWKIGEEEPRLERDVVAFKEALIKLLDSGVGIKTIRTWNEWHEGTQVEPGQLVNTSVEPYRPLLSYGEEFIDVMRQIIPNPYPYEPEIKVYIEHVCNGRYNIIVEGRGFPVYTSTPIIIDNKSQLGIAYSNYRGEFTYIIEEYRFEEPGLHIVIAGINNSIAVYPIYVNVNSLTNESSNLMGKSVDTIPNYVLLAVLIAILLIILHLLSRSRCCRGSTCIL